MPLRVETILEADENCCFQDEAERTIRKYYFLWGLRMVPGLFADLYAIKSKNPCPETEIQFSNTKRSILIKCCNGSTLFSERKLFRRRLES